MGRGFDVSLLGCDLVNVLECEAEVWGWAWHSSFEISTVSWGTVLRCVSIPFHTIFALSAKYEDHRPKAFCL